MRPRRRGAARARGGAMMLAILGFLVVAAMFVAPVLFVLGLVGVGVAVTGSRPKRWREPRTMRPRHRRAVVDSMAPPWHIPGEAPSPDIISRN
ncbi:MAG: hypothetical protein ABI119_03320 [Gemmatimonadaceae bacterium]